MLRSSRIGRPWAHVSFHIYLAAGRKETQLPVAPAPGSVADSARLAPSRFRDSHRKDSRRQTTEHPFARSGVVRSLRRLTTKQPRMLLRSLALVWSFCVQSTSPIVEHNIAIHSLRVDEFPRLFTTTTHSGSILRALEASSMADLLDVVKGVATVALIAFATRWVTMDKGSDSPEINGGVAIYRIRWPIRAAAYTATVLLLVFGIRRSARRLCRSSLANSPISCDAGIGSHLVRDGRSHFG